jgi:hypothetical protein
MGVEYKLVNMTKRECISFMHMGGSKMKELAGALLHKWQCIERFCKIS